jgi:hypothetical protein
MSATNEGSAEDTQSTPPSFVVPAVVWVLETNYVALIPQYNGGYVEQPVSLSEACTGPGLV